MATLRIPAALLSAMVVATVTMGAMVIVLNLYPEVGALQLVAHCAAGLCFGWVATLFVLQHRWSAFARRPAGRDLRAVLNIAAITLGLAAGIVIVYVAATEALRRTPYLLDYQASWWVDVWPSGLFDLALIAAAALVAWGRARDNQLLTVCFWIMALAGIWMSLQIPALRQVPTESGGSYPDLARWSIPFMVWSGLVVGGFAALEGAAHRHRRARAWPHALKNLTAPPPAWPGFHYSVGIIGVAILVLTCVHVATIWATVSAFAAGGALLAMVGRRWDENLADLGVGLLSIGIASLPLVVLRSSQEPSWLWFANVFNGLVIGLAMAVAFWHWLAGVWDQQLDDGRAWTTAGRLVRNARRVGFLCGATGVLVSLQLAFWPRFPRVEGLDDSTSRWFFGVGGDLLLVLALTYSARAAGKATLAWLAVFAIASLASFVLIRLGDHPLPLWWNRHWPLAIVVLAGVSLHLAVAAHRRTRWRPFGEPLLLFGLLIGPAAGLAGATLAQLQNMSPWVPAATFAALACVYSLAAVRPGPRAYLIAAAACAVMAAFRLMQMKGSTSL